MKTGIIVGAGEFTERDMDAETGNSVRAGINDTGAWKDCESKDILVIAADGGLQHLQRIGMAPDIVIGDFDSLGYVPEEICEGNGEVPADETILPEEQMIKRPEIICLPVEKDDTDMAAACRIAWERGCRILRIYGGSGSRPDHFLANLQLAALYSCKGCDVRLVTPDCTVFAVTDGSVELKGKPDVTFSVFCHSDRAEGVSIAGEAKYLLENARLTNTRALGVSNEMTGHCVRVSVGRGTLLVFLYQSLRE